MNSEIAGALKMKSNYKKIDTLHNWKSFRLSRTVIMRFARLERSHHLMEPHLGPKGLDKRDTDQPARFFDIPCT